MTNGNDKMFRVIPLRNVDKKTIDLIEAIVNHPPFVEKTVRATEEFVRQFMLPEMLYGKTFTEEEKHVGMQDIIAELNKGER